MKKPDWPKDLAVMVVTLSAACAAVVLFQQIMGRIDGVAMLLFVLAVFVISMYTEGYVWGVLASLISVLAVNFAFFTPYFAFNFTLPENLFSGLVMLVVSGMTSTASTSSSNTVGVFFTVTCSLSMRVTDSRFSTIRFSHWASSQASPNSLRVCSLPSWP